MQPKPETEPTTVDHQAGAAPVLTPVSGAAKLWMLTLGGSLLVAFATWAASETHLVRVAPRQVPMETMGQKHMGTTAATVIAALKATAGRGAGLLAGLLAITLGAAGGLARRTGRGRLAPILSAAAAGGLAAGLVAYFGVGLHARAVAALEDDLIPALLLQGTVGTVIGLTGALALGLGAGGPRSRRTASLIGGGAGGLLAAVAFQIAGGLLFPTDGVADPVAATSTVRLLSIVLVALLSSVGATAGLARR